jgi:dihydrofolate reductase
LAVLLTSNNLTIVIHFTLYCAMTGFSAFQTHLLENDPLANKPSDAMPPTPKVPPVPLTLILAATPKLGIGKGNQLPWPQLKTEMGYFARVTKRLPPVPPNAPTLAKPRINAVVMGRKTWDSIPEKFRPLKGRLNVVITSSWKDEKWKRTSELPDEGPLVIGKLSHLLVPLQERSAALPFQIERVFIIGGASIYKAALDLEDGVDKEERSEVGRVERVLLTKIHTEYECDTFFPADLDADDKWKRSSKEELQTFVGEEVKDIVQEKGVEFEFCMYEKKGAQ